MLNTNNFRIVKQKIQYNEDGTPVRQYMNDDAACGDKYDRPSYEYLSINDEYNGTYLVVQKVEVKSNRLDLPDNGYLVEIDQYYRLGADDVFFQPTIFTQN